ncbi:MULTISPECIES: signal protein [Streptomyces]|uniref:Signal protein n=2 Tax=Streptomyces TaxID=1883 RepID=A0ABY5F0K4_9ACTN|nr:MULTISPECIES: signal protein [Streptomyces]UTR77121.1 signal protein [Streptomyces cavourensis]
MGSTWKTGGFAALALIAVVGCGPATSAAAKPMTPAGELQSRWWTWAASEPEKTNPVADEDGSSCARNQPGDVWFLAGTFGGSVKRACTVPEGRPLVFPVVNSFGDGLDCLEFMEDAEGTAILDGQPIESEVYTGDTITVEALDGNAVTGEREHFTTTGCGLWVRMPAPGLGGHILQISGRSGDLSVDVEYRLTVEERPKDSDGRLTDQAQALIGTPTDAVLAAVRTGLL